MSFFRPRLDELPARDCPAVWTSGGRYATNFQNGTVFADYAGPLNAAAVETDTLRQFTVAAAPAAGGGGGPRLRVGRVDNTQYGGGEYPVHAAFDGFVFEPAFTGGVSVALGDVNGDATPDVIVGAASGGGPRVRVLDGRTFEPLADFFAFDPSFLGGVSVAVLDGDVVVAAGVGGAPHVRTFSPSGDPLSAFFAGDPDSRGGAQIATGDVLNFDGVSEIVALKSDGPAHAVCVYTPAGQLLADFAVLDDVAGSASVGVGYLGQSLVPHVLVAAGGVLENWDAHPLFPTGRRLGVFDYNAAYDRDAADLRAGTVRQLDGLARVERGGFYLSTDGEEAHYGALAPTYTTEEGHKTLLFPAEAQSSAPYATPLAAQWPLSEPLNSVVGGAAIGPAGHNQTGTLTGYVRSDDGVVYGLTNRHVVAVEGEPLVGTNVVQPGGGFGGTRVVGTVTATTTPDALADNFADVAAYAATTFDPRHGYERPDGTLGTVQTHGFGATHVGRLVYKFGFWGVRLGLVIADDATVSVRDGDATYTYTHQLVAASADGSFSWVQPGDSGSLVTDQTGLRVGQVFAGSAAVGIFSPLSAVFDAVGLHGSFVDKM